MSVNKKQIVIIAGALIVIVLLLLANTRLPEKVEAQASDHAGAKGQGQVIDDMVGKAKSALEPAQKSRIEKLEEAIKVASDKKSTYKNIITYWDSIRKPAVAAYYMEQLAIASSDEKNWNEAGNRYYMATRFSKEEEEKHLLFDKAIACFQKTLELNKNNVEAKINLAACYVEGSADPMKGIVLLKEVEKTDSNNVNLQLNFAFFSEKSGQWDKAIARFEKVLVIQPTFIEAYLHLADAYQQKGDNEKAIESLKKYSASVDDVAIKAEVQEYINQLSRRNSSGEKQ